MTGQLIFQSYPSARARVIVSGVEGRGIRIFGRCMSLSTPLEMTHYRWLRNH